MKKWLIREHYIISVIWGTIYVIVILLRLWYRWSVLIKSTWVHLLLLNPINWKLHSMVVWNMFLVHLVLKVGSLFEQSFCIHRHFLSDDTDVDPWIDMKDLSIILWYVIPFWRIFDTSISLWSEDLYKL